MVGGTTGSPGVVAKKSKDTSLLVELSRTSPLSFEGERIPSTETTETDLTGNKLKKKKKKKKKEIDLVHEGCTNDNLPSPTVAVILKDSTPMIKERTQEAVEKTSGHKKKKKRQLEEIPKQVVDLTDPEPDVLVKVNKKQKKEKRESETQQHSVEVSAEIEPEIRRTKEFKKVRSTEPKVGEQESVTVFPSEHHRGARLKTVTVRTEEHNTESSFQEANIEKERKKKKRTERHPGPPEPKATPEVGERRKRRKSQNAETEVTDKEMEHKRKKKKPDRGIKTAENRVIEVVLDSQTQGAESHPSTRDKGLQKTTMDGDKLEEDETWDCFSDCRDIHLHVEEMQEFIPNIKLKSPEAIQKLIKYDLHRFKVFKSQGIPLRTGAFTDVENQRLRKNVYDFMALTGIESTNHLFFPSRFKDQKASIKKLRGLHMFHEKIAEGIARPWHVVYVRGRKMFNEYNYKGRFTGQELHSLKKLHTLHGNNWKKISEVMDRSEGSLEKRFSQISINTGPWSTEETDHLLEAMKEFLQGLTEPELRSQQGEKFIKKEKLFNNIMWKEVSSVVATRSWTQCREKWMSYLNRRITLGGETAFSRGIQGTQSKVDLIRRLYEMQVEDAADVDWEDLAEAIGNVTPYHVQKQFFRLKVTKVPLWENMTFCDIVDYLYAKVLPVLKESLDTNEPADTNDGPREHFLLSEIFCPETEVDNVK